MKQFSDGTYRPRHATVMGLLTTFRSVNTAEWTAMMARHDANRLVLITIAIRSLITACPKGSCDSSCT
jgi:hypothetical protein